MTCESGTTKVDMPLEEIAARSFSDDRDSSQHSGLQSPDLRCSFERWRPWCRKTPVVQHRARRDRLATGHIGQIVGLAEQVMDPDRWGGGLMFELYKTKADPSIRLQC